jgi:hypothetical protein
MFWTREEAITAAKLYLSEEMRDRTGLSLNLVKVFVEAENAPSEEDNDDL